MVCDKCDCCKRKTRKLHILHMNNDARHYLRQRLNIIDEDKEFRFCVYCHTAYILGLNNKKEVLDIKTQCTYNLMKVKNTVYNDNKELINSIARDISKNEILEKEKSYYNYERIPKIITHFNDGYNNNYCNNRRTGIKNKNTNLVNCLNCLRKLLRNK